MKQETTAAKQVVLTPQALQPLSKELLTLKDVALLLQVSERQVRNLIYKGRLKACRLSYHKTVIPKKYFLEMMETNDYNQMSPSIFSVQRKPKSKTIKKTETKEVHLSQTKGKEKHPTTTAAKKQRKSIPMTDYKQTVKTTFVENDTIEGDVYTLAEICQKFNYTYGRFYNLRMKYSIPCVKGHKTKCFPVDAVDKAMEDERISQGKDLTEHYYSCFDIMRIYGLGKTQVRRFAQTHGVRIKRCGKNNFYLKADWEAARKQSEAKSNSTKPKRE